MSQVFIDADKSSATAATRRADWNGDAMPPGAAAHGRRHDHCSAISAFKCNHGTSKQR